MLAHFTNSDLLSISMITYFLEVFTVYTLAFCHGIRRREFLFLQQESYIGLLLETSAVKIK